MDTHRRISYKRNLRNWLMVTQEALGERKLKFLNCSSLIEEYSTTTYGHPSVFSNCSLLHLFPKEDKCSRFFALLDVAQVLLQWKCRKIWFKYRSLFLFLEYLFIGYFRSVFSEVHKSSSSSHSSTLYNFLNFHLKKTLVLAISKNNETINRTLNTTSIDGYFWASNTQVRPVSRIPCGSISKAIYFWVRRECFWETLRFWAPVELLQLLPRHYVVCICFIPFVYANTRCTCKMEVRGVELGRGDGSSPGKQLSRLQGERERDCTAEGEEQKQGPASQVAEEDTWDPEGNMQRLQHFWKALHWEPLFIIGCTGQAEMWSLFLAYLVSQGTGCASPLWVFFSFKMFYFIFW